MKAFLFALLLLLTATSLHAQRVAADVVPDAVKAAFAREHADKSATWWERQGQKPSEGFLAVVLQPKSQTLRVCYSAEGARRFSVLHYPGELVPTLIKSKVGAENPYFRVYFANEVNSVQKGRYFFVWLVGAGAQKGLWVTPTGDALGENQRDPLAANAEAQSN